MTGKSSKNKLERVSAFKFEDIIYATADIHFFFGNPQLIHKEERYDGKGLIHFKDIDFVNGQTGPLDRLLGGRHRPGQHNGHILSNDGIADKPGAGFQVVFIESLLRGHQDNSGAVERSLKNTSGVIASRSREFAWRSAKQSRKYSIIKEIATALRTSQRQKRQKFKGLADNTGELPPVRESSHRGSPSGRRQRPD